MENYSKLERFQHKVVLGSSLIGEILLGIERSMFLNNSDANNTTQPVYVTGLARAGTTVLMRSLYSSGQFASLTYDDMPFVMAPNLWQKIVGKNKKKRVKGERAHGDGIQVDYDSPEALEEVFWRTYHGDDYLKGDVLVPHEFSDETAMLFQNYQLLICKRYGKDRYLSKNNNNILRIRSISKSCDGSMILVPFRNPLEQSYSLLRQHKKFQDSSLFVRDYMSWLAHHEFGMTHKPFVFDEGQENSLDSNTLDYWLERWIQAYHYILTFIEEEPENVIPICYERLCKDKSYWPKVCEIVNIREDTHSDFIALTPKKLPESSVELQNMAMVIYEKLEWLSKSYCPQPTKL